MLADSSLTIPEWLKGHMVVLVPILQSAVEKVGKSFVANIIAVAVINKALGLVSEDILRQAVAAHIPKGTEALNFKALEVGEGLL